MENEQKPPQETEVEALTRQLGERDNAFGKMKQQYDTQVADLTAKLSSATAQAEAAATSTAALAKATARYLALLVQTNPDIPAEMIKGSTVDELEASLAAGKAMVQKVKESLEAHPGLSGPIPAGAPPRQGIDLTGLSPQAKIIEGLKQHDRRK